MKNFLQFKRIMMVVNKCLIPRLTRLGGGKYEKIRKTWIPLKTEGMIGCTLLPLLWAQIGYLLYCKNNGYHHTLVGEKVKKVPTKMSLRVEIELLPDKN